MPPPNDNFASAHDLTVLATRHVYSVAGTLTGSTLESDEPLVDSTSSGTFLGSVWYRFVVPSGTQGIFRYSTSFQNCHPTVGGIDSTWFRQEGSGLAGLAELFYTHDAQPFTLGPARTWAPLVLNCEGHAQGNSGTEGVAWAVKSGEVYYLRLLYGNNYGNPGGFILDFEYEYDIPTPTIFTNDRYDLNSPLWFTPPCPGTPLATTGFESRQHVVNAGCMAWLDFGSGITPVHAFVVDEYVDDQEGVVVERYWLLAWDGSTPTFYGFLSLDGAFRTDRPDSDDHYWADGSGNQGLASSPSGGIHVPFITSTPLAGGHYGDHAPVGVTSFRDTTHAGTGTSGWAAAALASSGFATGGGAIQANWGGPGRPDNIFVGGFSGTPATLRLALDGTLLEIYDWWPTIGWTGDPMTVCTADGRYLIGSTFTTGIGWEWAVFDLTTHTLGSLTSMGGLGIFGGRIVGMQPSTGRVIVWDNGDGVSLLDPVAGSGHFVIRSPYWFASFPSPVFVGPHDYLMGAVWSFGFAFALCGVSHDGSKLYAVMRFATHEMTPFSHRYRDFVSLVVSCELVPFTSGEPMWTEEFIIEHPFHDTIGMPDTTPQRVCLGIPPRGKLSMGPQTTRSRVPIRSTATPPTTVTLGPSASGVPSAGGGLQTGPSSVRPR